MSAERAVEQSSHDGGEDEDRSSSHVQADGGGGQGRGSNSIRAWQSASRLARAWGGICSVVCAERERDGGWRRGRVRQWEARIFCKAHSAQLARISAPRSLAEADSPTPTCPREPLQLFTKTPEPPHEPQAGTSSARARRHGVECCLFLHAGGPSLRRPSPSNTSNTWNTWGRRSAA